MNISSRTPEGLPNDCPVCGAQVCVEPSLLFGDATCPHCGSLIWFLRLQSETFLFDSATTQSKRQRVIKFIAEQLGISPSQITDDPAWLKKLGADSIDLVELVMELEEEFDKD